MNSRIMKPGILLLALVLMLASCRKDSVDTKKDIIINPPVTLVESSLLGQVFDEDGNILEGAVVMNGNNSAETDENGVFQFTNVLMNEYGQLITANVEGFFLGAKMVQASVGSQHYVQFNLIEKETIGSFDASQGGMVNSAEGVQISFPTNAIIDANDMAYTGEVQVYASFIDPTGQNINEIMPGDLRAVNEDSDFVQLETYGMVAVELEDSNGNALNIAEDMEATLVIPIDASLSSIAPATIPLWHFDEVSGYWVQEGEATLDGNAYVGKVSHFSFWNCDYPYPLIELTGAVVDGNGNGIAFMTVQAELTNGNSVGYAYTDDNGQFGGKVPANEEMVISVYQWSCGTSNTLYEATVGPFSIDTDLGDLVIDPQEDAMMNIVADITDCDMEAISNGYLKVDANGTKIFPADDNGHIDATFVTCDATTMDVTAYDPDNLKKSSTETHDIDGITFLDLGTIAACDEDITELIEYTLDDGVDQVYYVILDPSAGIDDPALSIEGNGMDSLFVNILTLGYDLNTPINPEYASFGDPNNPNGGGAFCQGCEDFNVTYTAVGEVGEPITGTFEGTMQTTGSVITVTGSFAAIRDY